MCTFDVKGGIEMFVTHRKSGFNAISQLVLTTLVTFTAILFFLSSPAFSSMTPGSADIILNPSESFDETKTVDLPGTIPKGDILFSFDLTGSMGGAISTAKTEAINIMNSLDALIDDSRYAVASYMDYPHSYSSCGYTATYGWGPSGDYAYSLDLAMSDDPVAISSAINGLVLGSGYDGPQDYTRIMYESYADAGIGYRTGAKKILLNFGDNVPHDCDLKEDVPGLTGTWSTGGDPGPDEIMGTADDLDLQTVLAEMADNDITLLEVHTTSSYSVYWDYWTGLTGGEIYVLSDVANLPQAIYDLIQAQAQSISSLTLEVTTPGFESWLASVSPASYANLELPVSGLTFDVTITVPPGTLPGTYEFYVSAMGDGASYGDQLVTITVPDEGCVAGTLLAECPAPGTPMYGVEVDAYEAGTGSLIGSAVTDEFGYYEICELEVGDYNITAVTPLGYSAVYEEILVTVMGGDTVITDFDFYCSDLESCPRTIGFWKHQVGVATGGNGKAQVDDLTLCSYLDMIADHFNSNSINQVIIYQPPGGGATCDEKLLVAKELLNLKGSVTMLARAKQQLMALLLNVASGYIHQMEVISGDGATVSQAITYCDNIIDDPYGDYETAKTIADMINNGKTVPAGMIPLSTDNIVYKLTPTQFSLKQNFPNPFNPTTEISYDLNVPGKVTLEIFNIMGQRINLLVDQYQDVGTHTVVWNGRDAAGSTVASGVYFYRLKFAGSTETRKMLLMK